MVFGNKWLNTQQAHSRIDIPGHGNFMTHPVFFRSFPIKENFGYFLSHDLVVCHVGHIVMITALQIDTISFSVSARDFKSMPNLFIESDTLKLCR